MLPPGVRSYVQDFDVRARRLSLLRAVGLASAVFVLWMLCCCVADRFGQFPTQVRLGLLAAGALAATVILFRPLRNAMRDDVDWVATAASIERHNSHFA